MVYIKSLSETTACLASICFATVMTWEFVYAPGKIFVILMINLFFESKTVFFRILGFKM